MKLFYEVIYDFILSLRGAQKIFGGLNQKLAINMCKIYIYIDSECFRQLH